jgi:hypothetical protein
LTKQTVKKALKVKYEARLKDMKKEFEAKFKRNEQTWKSRLDFHKQALGKEQMKANEYESVIQEMSERINIVEKKNKDMYHLIKMLKEDKVEKSEIQV